MPRSSSLTKIEQQIAALQRQADKLREAEKAGVIARIKEAIAHYALTESDLGFGATAKRSRRVVTKVAKKKAVAGKPKFSDGAGHTWSGRGPKPQWYREALASGKTEADLLV